MTSTVSASSLPVGANLGWAVTLVADACDCFDLPDGNGRTIPAEAVHSAHVATLAYEVCKVVSTQAISPLGLSASRASGSGLSSFPAPASG
jgi:hypothetical protein